MVPLVSVVVPFFEHHSVLPECLAALAGQTYRADRFEVIVVDNSVEDDTLRLPRLPTVKLCREREAGSYRARNKGIEAASGQILAFTDADCRPHPDWIESGVKRLGCLRGPAVIGGQVRLTYRDPAKPNAIEIYDTGANLRQRSYIAEMHFAVTANLLASREVFEQVGVFNPRLMGGGDWEWGQRVHGSGTLQIFAGEVMVEHPARASLRGLIRKTLRQAGGMIDREQWADMGPSRLPFDLAREAKRALRQWRLVRASPLGTSGSAAALAAVHCVVTLTRLFETVRIRTGGSARRS